MNTEAARKVFEAIVAMKGVSDLTRKGDRYKNPNTQTKWRYFLLGWTLKNENTHR